MLEILEILEERISKGQDIDEVADELNDAIEVACDDGEIEYSVKNEIIDLVGKITESYSFDSEDTTIPTDIAKLKELINDL